MRAIDKRWLWGGGALLMILFLTRKTGPEDDIDALTQMLLTETDFQKGRDEMAQIVYVALNRMKRGPRSAREVVTASSWNNNSAYKERFDRMFSHPRWETAREFVADIYTGKGPSNQRFVEFRHPQGMPTPPCGAGVAMQTNAGVRCMPERFSSGKYVGSAVFV